MKRFIDDYNADIENDGTHVVCPKCTGLGIVESMFKDGNYDYTKKHFKCTTCFYSQTHDTAQYRYQANMICSNCARYVRTDIKRELASYPVLNVSCPHCNTIVGAETQKIALGYWGYGGIIIKDSFAIDPDCGYVLYFQSSFDGKPIFAKNRKHLQHLIDYIEADLRIKPSQTGGAMRKLPSFMKSAKNRKGILKILRRLQTG